MKRNEFQIATAALKFSFPRGSCMFVLGYIHVPPNRGAAILLSVSWDKLWHLEPSNISNFGSFLFRYYKPCKYQKFSGINLVQDNITSSKFTTKPCFCEYFLSLYRTHEVFMWILFLSLLLWELVRDKM